MNQADNAIIMDLFIIVIHLSSFSINISELIMFDLSFRSYDQSFNFWGSIFFSSTNLVVGHFYHLFHFSEI
jgi:hypothetical protein